EAISRRSRRTRPMRSGGRSPPSSHRATRLRPSDSSRRTCPDNLRGRNVNVKWYLLGRRVEVCNFARYLILGGRGGVTVGWRQGVSQPTLVPFVDATTMTAGICRQRLGPAKRPSYSQVMAYATSRPDIRGNQRRQRSRTDR